MSIKWEYCRHFIFITHYTIFLLFRNRTVFHWFSSCQELTNCESYLLYFHPVVKYGASISRINKQRFSKKKQKKKKRFNDAQEAYLFLFRQQGDTVSKRSGFNTFRQQTFSLLKCPGATVNHPPALCALWS